MKEEEILSAVKKSGGEEGDSVSLSLSADIDMEDLQHIVYLLQMMIDKNEEYGSENLNDTLKSMSEEKTILTHRSNDSEDSDPLSNALSLMMTVRYTFEAIADKFSCDEEELYKLLYIPDDEVEKELEKIYSKGTFFQA